MSDVLERLDKLKARIQEEDFLKGNGLSNEVNIHIFCYDPADEMAVRYFTEQLVSDQSLQCHVIEKNIYKTVIEMCEAKRVLKAIPSMEEKIGSKNVQEKIAGFADNKAIAKKITEECFESGDVLLLTHIGEAYPMARAHAILDAIQPNDIDKIPIVVMYPGKFNGRELQLFGKFKPNNYYRAFNAI